MIGVLSELAVSTKFKLIIPYFSHELSTFNRYLLNICLNYYFFLTNPNPTIVIIMGPELITDTVLEWFQTLDYEYMVLHIIICYGLYYSKNLRWIVERFSPIRKKGISKAVWLTGGVLAALEIIRFFTFYW